VHRLEDLRHYEPMRCAGTGTGMASLWLSRCTTSIQTACQTRSCEWNFEPRTKHSAYRTGVNAATSLVRGKRLRITSFERLCSITSVNVGMHSLHGKRRRPILSSMMQASHQLANRKSHVHAQRHV